MVGVFKKRRNFAARIVAAALAAVLCVSSVPCAAFAQAVNDANAQSASGAASQEARVAEDAGEGADAIGAGFEVGAGEGAGTAGIGAGSNGEAAAGVASGGADECDAGTGAVVSADAGAIAASAERPPLSSASAGLSETQDFATQELEARTNAAAQFRDDRIALASASYDYSGIAHCWFRNDSPTDYVFTVEIDGVSYEAYCLDPALPAPANGWYTFYATWDDDEKAYDIVLDTKDAEVHWSQVDIGLGCQSVGGFRIYAKGDFTLTKSSSNLEVSGIYNVAGAVYGLYWYYVDAQAGNEPDYRLVIGDDGSSDTLTGLTPDERWYVRELEAPTGFALDPTIYTVPIRPNQDNSYHVTDEPVMDPNNVLLKKVTADGQEYLGEHLSLAMAEYQFDYYAGYYDTVEQARASGDPTRSWVLRTNNNGYTGVRYADKTFTHDGVEYPYLVNGEVYRASSGKPSMPLGTLVIHETNPPFGYKVSSSIFIAQLKQADNEFGYEWAFGGEGFADGNVALDKESVDAGSLTILKKSKNPDLTAGINSYSLAGARFDIYDNAACQGEPKYTLVTKENGTTDTIEELPPGLHLYIKEAIPPQGFKESSDVYEVIIKPGEVSVTTVVIENVPVYAAPSVSLVKKDSNGDQAFKGSATLAEAEYTFAFYAGKSSAQGTPDATWVGVTDREGRTSLDQATLVSGSEWLIEGQCVLPLGFLTVEETKAPQGYQKSNEVFSAQVVYDEQTRTAKWVKGDALSDDADFRDAIEFEAAEDIKLFGISVYKKIQGAQTGISPEGIQFEIVYKPTGEVVKTITIGADGTATTGERALPCGSYEVREVEESVPAGLLPYSATSKTGSNVIDTIDAPDDGYFPLYQVIQTECTDYTSDTPHGEKKDHTTGQPIAGMEFTLYRYTGSLVIDDGSVDAAAADFDPYQDYWSQQETVMTDAHGKFEFSTQPYGVYMMVETNPEWHYLSTSEGEYDGASKDPLATARVFVIDKDHPCEMQLWEDIAIQLECTVDKSTISVTSSGLISKESSDAEDTVSNVGIEEYRYDVSFDSGNTNTYADEYWMVDQLNMVCAPFDLRVTTIVLPVVENDSIPTVALLIKTNKSTGESWAPAVETACHESTLCDGSSRFNGAGWRFAGTYSSDTSTMISVESLGLARDEYLTGLCLYYGAVEKDFSTLSPLSYMVVATHELAEGVVIPNTATSHITRNWAQRDGSVNGLSDDDIDSVATTVLGTFEQHFDRGYSPTSSGRLGSWKPTLPQTGDAMLPFGLLALAGALTCAAAGVYIFARNRRIRVRLAGKGSAVGKSAGKMMGFFVALLLVALPLAGCSCSRQGIESASSDASAAASASGAAASSTSASSDAAASASSDDVDAGEDNDDSSEEASSSGDSSSSSQGGGSDSSWTAPSSAPAGGSSGGDPSSETSEPQPAAHEHSWEWVPQWVDVVHREAYDKPVYRWATWCYKCNVEVSDSHGEDMFLQGDGGHNLTDKKVLDHYEHVEAETHQEDHGYYRCSTCGETY